MKGVFLLAIFAMIAMASITQSALAISVTSCGNLNVDGGYYTLSSNLTQNNVAPCINITANNVTLDGQWNTISYGSNTPLSNGLINVSYVNNATIMNLNVEEYRNPAENTLIQFFYSNRSSLINVKIINSSFIGFNCIRSLQTSVINSSINTSSIGLSFTTLSNDSVVTQSYFKSTSAGTTACLRFNTASKNISMYNNLFNCSNTNVGFNEALSTNLSFNNSEIGNYWGNPSGTGYSDTCVDGDANWICDSPYQVYGDGDDFKPKSTFSFLVYKYGLSVVNSGNAWNNSYIGLYSMFFNNGTTSVTKSTSLPFKSYNWSELPTGDVSITFYKSGYENFTLPNVPINATGLNQISAYLVARGDMVRILNPQNTTYFGGSVPMNFVTPTLYGNIFNIKYNTTSPGGNISVNTSSSGWSGIVTINPQSQYIVVWASQFSTGIEYNSSIYYSLLYSQFNINVYDEMTGFWYTKQAGSNWTLAVQCDNYINYTTLTANPTINFTAQCTNPEIKLTINDTLSNTQFRTLRPISTLSNLSFFMINRSISSALYQNLLIDDLTGSWGGAAATISKPIPTLGSQNIIQQVLDAEKKMLVYLIDNEVYTLTLTNGFSTRVFTIKATSRDVQIKVGVTNISLDTDTSSTFKNIGFGYTYVAGTSLSMSYSDKLNTTSSIIWLVYNESNTSQLLQSFSTAYSNSTTFTYAPIPANTSLYTTLNIMTGQYGQIYETKYWYWNNGIFMGFGLDINVLYIAANLLIIFFALMFSAYDAQIGGILTLFMAGMLYYWGWLNPAVFGGLVVMVIIIFALAFRDKERSGI